MALTAPRACAAPHGPQAAAQTKHRATSPRVASPRSQAGLHPILHPPAAPTTMPGPADPERAVSRRRPAFAPAPETPP
eukprot:4922284-Prymnesium_polylepis.2